MNKKSLIEDIRDTIEVFQDDEKIFDELRKTVYTFNDKNLINLLEILIDECEEDNEDAEMTLSILETEIEQYKE